MQGQNRWRNRITSLLWNMFELQYGGAPGTKFRYQQGFVDGYIQACIDLQAAQEREMLGMIQMERARYLEGTSYCATPDKKAA